MPDECDIGLKVRHITALNGGFGRARVPDHRAAEL
jgi:hypothetical protein